MPYTPPARSPTASHATSPAQTPSVRPRLPHSNSGSASYTQRHRRSPSLPGVAADGEGKHAFTLHSSGSVRASPPPVTDVAAMPAGAMLSPPESPQNYSDNDDDDTARTGVEPTSGSPRQGRRAGFDAVYTNGTAVTDSPTTSSTTATPDGTRHFPQQPQPQPQLQQQPQHSSLKTGLTLQPPSVYYEASSPDGHSKPPMLSQAARKISHSRSATEASFFDLPVASQSLPGSMSQSDDSEEDFESAAGSKPPLLRKKSGELVKPAIRPRNRRKHSSMPGTPTFSKAVHFNEDIEQVRHFLQVDRPIAVSAGASPVDGLEDETEFPFGSSSSSASSSASSRRLGELQLGLKNFPHGTNLERMSKPLYVDRLYLSPDQKSLVGVVDVANLAFHKSVVARFTFDYWKTTSEVVAAYSNDVRATPKANGYDEFKFSIKLTEQANLESRTMLLCVRYNVNGEEHWDNNNGMNFQADFARGEAPAGGRSEAASPSPQGGAASSAAGPSLGKTSPSIPRSRHNSAVSVGRSRAALPSFDDDFARGFEGEPIKFRHSGDTPPRRRQVPGGAHFSTRYDFGASLSAALSHAQQALGDRSGIKPKRPAASAVSASSASDKEPAPPSTTLPVRTGPTATVESGAGVPRPDTLLANRQSLDSQAYQEFVSKYCFFGSNNTASPSTGTPAGPGNTSATQPPANHARTSSPSGIDGANDEHIGSAKQPQYVATPPAFGPALREGVAYDSSGYASPMQQPGGMPYGYHYSPELQSGLMTPDFQHPQAIQG